MTCEEIAARLKPLAEEISRIPLDEECPQRDACARAMVLQLVHLGDECSPESRDFVASAITAAMLAMSALLSEQVAKSGAVLVEGPKGVQ